MNTIVLTAPAVVLAQAIPVKKGIAGWVMLLIVTVLLRGREKISDW